jgi:hypothetical protein
MIKRNPEILIPLVKELESHIAFKDKRKDSISKSDIAWQIDHSLKVFNLVSESLMNSNPELYSSKFSKWRLLFFTISYFPRGKVKAPKFVRPPELISSEDLVFQLQLAHQNIGNIKLANKNAHFKHFIFGVLNKNWTIKFLQLHTNHHLKIIRDILK